MSNGTRLALTTLCLIVWIWCIFFHILGLEKRINILERQLTITAALDQAEEE